MPSVRQNRCMSERLDRMPWVHPRCFPIVRYLLLVAQHCCRLVVRSGISWGGQKPRSFLKILRSGPHPGRPLTLLLPEFRVPRSRETRGGKFVRDQSLRPRQVPPHAPLPDLSGAVLRAPGNGSVRGQARPREGRIGPGAHRRGGRRPPDRAALPREPPSRGPLQPVGRRARPTSPRRTRGVFPRTPVRSSSTRRGPSSARRKPPATAPTRPTTPRGTTGTPWPGTRSTAWS